MANIIESRVTLEDEVFEETIDTAEEPIEVVRPTSYNGLQDLPQVNGVTLQGNKTSSDLGIVTQNDINSAVSAEATLRENADTALGGRIDQEITDRSEAEIALGGRIDGEITNRTNADNALGTRIDNEILARQGGDNNLQTQIDAITSKSDVVDVVATYADLQAYDTQHLGNNDVIKVLDDETHDHSQTYYRWNKPNSTWTYIGSEAPYYSKSQIDTQMAQKQDKLVAGSNIQIASDGKTISATDTTYTAGTGLTLTGTEFSADMTVLATKTEVAPKLQTEVVAELPTTGEEDKLYLTPKNYTTGTATGNPIDMDISKSMGIINSFRIDGDAVQDGTPTADSPIAVQTVTGTQTITIGRDIVPEDVEIIVARLQGSGSILYNITNRLCTESYIPVKPNTEYTIVAIPVDKTKVMQAFAVGYGSKNDAAIANYPSNGTWGNLPYSLTTGSNCRYIRIGMRFSDDSDIAVSDMRWVGVLESSQQYPVNLGTIELCKVASVQDYIYNFNGSWFVHKEVSKIQPTGNESGIDIYSGMTRIPVSGLTTGSTAQALSTHFAWEYANNLNKCYLSTTSRLAMGIPNITTVSEAQEWLAENTPVFYCILTTPTDTVITDSTLIAELDAIKEATLPSGAACIANTASGTNLAGDLELGYYEYDPQNRYDKWLWLDLNNNYEKLGS